MKQTKSGHAVRKMNIKIRKCTADDIDDLEAIAYETYNETFRPMNSKETMEKYLNEAFNRDRLKKELANKDNRFYFLYADQALAGYLKINDASAQTDINDIDSIEVERIYIRKAYKGKGFGTTLLNHAVQLAKDKKKNYIWLGVWEKNTAAISFYTNMGFHETGYHLYKMGDEFQNDLIMKRKVNNI